MTTDDLKLKSELEAVFQSYGRNTLTLEEFEKAGFPGARTLVLRGFLKFSKGTEYSRGWLKHHNGAVRREGKHYGSALNKIS